MDPWYQVFALQTKKKTTTRQREEPNCLLLNAKFRVPGAQVAPLIREPDLPRWSFNLFGIFCITRCRRVFLRLFWFCAGNTLNRRAGCQNNWCFWSKSRSLNRVPFENNLTGNKTSLMFLGNNGMFVSAETHPGKHEHHAAALNHFCGAYEDLLGWTRQPNNETYSPIIDTLLPWRKEACV